MSQDFTIAATAGASLSDWYDPAAVSAPSRINSIDGFPQRRYVGDVGVPIEITATVAGVAGPFDADPVLTGRLFRCFRVENPPWPGHTMPHVFGFSYAAGKTSVQSFTPEIEGHYTIGFWRDNGGIYLLHFDVAP